MLTKEMLAEANEKLAAVDVKGKGYVMVTERVKAFRALIPEGTISTEIIAHDGGTVLMKATITDETGHVLATGLSFENQSSSYINKTSYIENCETSAVGRALGFLGIGIDGSMASADEVANAMLQQQADQPIDDIKLGIIRADFEKGVIDEDKLLEHYKLDRLEDMTESQFRKYANGKNKKK